MLLVGGFLRARPPVQVAFAGLGVCVIVELSQLWHPAWLDALRATTPGRLVLGRGFLWEDLLAYVVGAASGWGVETLLRRPKSRTPPG